MRWKEWFVVEAIFRLNCSVKGEYNKDNEFHPFAK